MALTPVSNESSRRGDKFITIDKYRRICLSTSLRKELALKGNEWLYVSFDNENKRIGVVKSELAKLPNVKPFKFDARGYTSANSILENNVISEADLPLRFVDIGKIHEGGVAWRAFELEKKE
jgi:hypothetical protein